ncbi:MAG: UDP-N-acetylmuramate--L-alanine ligase [Firmicutes bacterium]|nr:UDP-N-acetylmuramate--L-alanine ligase [Bacillota bacterium]
MNNIHFIGIGGTGMSGLAKICIEKGLNVTGSDLKNSETIQKLRILGATIKIGHDKLPEGTTLVVFSTAVSENNSEIIDAKNKNIPLWHRSDILRFVSDDKIVYGVAGAHGKTTTTTMLAEIFVRGERNPSIAAGGKLVFEGANGKYDSKGDIFLAELDESDGSFLKIKVDTAIITNIDDDHLDYYTTKDNIDKAFAEFIENVEGKLIVNGHDKTIMRLLSGKSNVITFGFKDCDYTMDEVHVQNYRNTAKAYYKGQYIGTINIPLPGNHNLQNALGAIALARDKKIADDVIFKALSTFQGVGRRFEIIGQKKGRTIVDDYAHHPKEIEALLSGAKSFGYKRVICIFQPHRYTRTKQLYNDFVKVLKNSDICIVNTIYSAGEKVIEGINSQNLAKDIGGIYIENFNDIVDYILENSNEEDLILTIGAGDICEVGEMILKSL